MAEHAEFSAAELDHLEDALEGLEFAPPREGAPHVRHRLDEYRNILALSRAAMPMVEVPRGLLDDVLAQARAAAEVPALTPVSALPPPRPGFWSRLRRFGLLPGVALAGTAAIVMLMVERKPDELAAAKSEPAPVAGPADARARAVQSAPAETKAEARAPVEAQTAAPADVAAPKPTAPAAEPPPAPGRSSALGYDAALDAPKDADEGAEKGKREAPAAAEQSDRKVVDAEMARWDTISRGDRARHRGECGEARSEYALALDDVDARVRARAHAGLGLCDAAEGDRTRADAAYKVARELDGEIVRFIENERARGAGSSGGLAKPKAASKAKVDPPPQVDQLDPLGK